MQVNIIHLKHRTDRLQLLLKELQSQGITDYKIWDGVIKHELTVRNISEAHKNIVRNAKETGLKEILICEDDIHFSDKNSFSDFIDMKPDDFDLYLASVSWGKFVDDRTVSDFSGLTFYIINERFYDYFLSANSNINIDRALKGMGKYIVSSPFKVVQHSGYSDNYKKWCNYENVFNASNI